MTSGIPSPRAQKYYAHRFASDSSPTPLISVHQSKQRRVDEKAEHDAFLAKFSSKTSRIARDGTIERVKSDVLPLGGQSSKGDVGSAGGRRFKSTPLLVSRKSRVKYRRQTSRPKPKDEPVAARASSLMDIRTDESLENMSGHVESQNFKLVAQSEPSRELKIHAKSDDVQVLDSEPPSPSQDLRSAALRVLRQYPKWNLETMKEMTKAVKSTVWKDLDQGDLHGSHADTSEASVSLNPDDYDIPNLPEIAATSFNPNIHCAQQRFRQPANQAPSPQLYGQQPRPMQNRPFFENGNASPTYRPAKSIGSHSRTSSIHSNLTAKNHVPSSIPQSPAPTVYNSGYRGFSSKMASEAPVRKYQSFPMLHNPTQAYRTSWLPAPASSTLHPYPSMSSVIAHPISGTQQVYGPRPYSVGVSAQQTVHHTYAPHVLHPGYPSTSMLPPLPPGCSTVASTPLPTGAMSAPPGLYPQSFSPASTYAQAEAPITLPPILAPSDQSQQRSTSKTVAKAAEGWETSSMTGPERRSANGKTFAPIKLGGLGPNVGSEEHLAKLDKWQKQRQYGAQVRAMARNALHKSAGTRSAPDVQKEQQLEVDKHLTRQSASELFKSRHASDEKLEQAIAKREKMKSYASSIKKPTSFKHAQGTSYIPTSTLAIKSLLGPYPTPAVGKSDLQREKHAHPSSWAGSGETELQRLENEHAKGIKAVESIRRELGI